ncbi:F-box only protein 39 [Rhinoderma darwinii]|uniref:F-box only protein 39 n=1 Tax=Rhinoderma darwinii TaxID=43563 RepID=UPI003F677268
MGAHLSFLISKEIDQQIIYTSSFDQQSYLPFTGSKHQINFSGLMDMQNIWEGLPEICLQNIFHYLGDQDRFNAALVCKRWNQVMNSATLWKFRIITFRGRSITSCVTEYNSAVWYIYRFGKYVKNLEIRFLNSYNTFFTRKFQNVMTNILSSLGRRNQRLKSLSMPYLDMERLIWKSHTRDAFVKSLCTFLRKMGSRLEYLNLRGAKMSFQHGQEVLHSLSYSRSVTNITKLDIEDFFSSHLHVYHYETFIHAMSSFQNLSILSLNYSCISDDLLQVLCANCSHSLLTINIKCHLYNPHLQIVWGMYWAQLANKARNLCVNFYIVKVLLYSHLSRILLREIPVRHISIRSSYLSDPEWYISPTLLELLPNYRKTLKKLTLELNNSHEIVDEQLLNLILSCNSLHYVKIWAFLDVQFVEAVLQNCEQDKIFLRTMKVRIYTSNYDTSGEDQSLCEILGRHMDFILRNMDYYNVVTCPML